MPDKSYTQAEVDAIVKSAKAKAWQEGVEEGGQYQTDSYSMSGLVPEPQNPYTED
jgi:hypothetical protein